jgi:L-gulonate 5-dehydrogenase
VLRMVTEASRRVSARSAEPAPVGAGRVRIRVERVGVCGSDAHVYEGTHPYLGYPLVQGHEVVGIVEQVGATVAGIAPGDRVVVEPTLPCGDCVACRRGRGNCCVALDVIGITSPGGLAERLDAPATALHRVVGLDPDVAVLVEPLAVALHGVDRAEPVAGEVVLVLGAGSIGRSVVLAAHHRGARVVVAERMPERRALLPALGAERVVSTDPDEIASTVRELAGEDGCPVVIDTTGNAGLLELGLDLVAHSGVVVAIGISPDRLRVPVAMLTRKEVSLLGARNSAGEFAEAIRVAEEHADALRATISCRLPLERAEEAFRLVLERAVVGKVIVDLDVHGTVDALGP